MSTNSSVRSAPAPGAHFPWVNAAKQPKPKAKRANKKREISVDPDTLMIDRESVYSIALIRPPKPGKYDHIFNELPIGKSIVCKPDETHVISNAMRHWASKKKLEVKVKSVTNFKKTGQARVFLLPAKSAKPGADKVAKAAK